MYISISIYVYIYIYIYTHTHTFFSLQCRGSGFQGAREFWNRPGASSVGEEPVTEEISSFRERDLEVRDGEC